MKRAVIKNWTKTEAANFLTSSTQGINYRPNLSTAHLIWAIEHKDGNSRNRIVRIRCKMIIIRNYG